MRSIRKPVNVANSGMVEDTENRNKKINPHVSSLIYFLSVNDNVLVIGIQAMSSFLFLLFLRAPNSKLCNYLLVFSLTGKEKVYDQQLKRGPTKVHRCIQ